MNTKNKAVCLNNGFCWKNAQRQAKKEAMEFDYQLIIERNYSLEIA